MLTLSSVEDAVTDCDLDPLKIERLERDWAEQERWFQMDRSSPDEYAFPVLGSRQVAQEGEEAYYLYRDAFLPFLETIRGTDDVVRDLMNLYGALSVHYPTQIKELASDLFEFDDAFVTQWKNLFGDLTWPGLTHDSLGCYVRKYEVEWPLRCLACLVDLHTIGQFDAGLAAHRDRSGRLLKGHVISHVTERLSSYPALQNAVRTGYSSTLRNAIGHNDYEITADAIRSLDGNFAEGTEQVWSRVRLLQTVQNALLWLRHSVTRRVSQDLAMRGIMFVAWLPLTEGQLPRALVGQLAPFHQLDLQAAWLQDALLCFEDGKLMTQFGGARARAGQIVPDLLPVLAELQRTGRMVAELVPIMPCLHRADDDHLAFTSPEGTYCEAGASVEREVLVTLRAE